MFLTYDITREETFNSLEAWIGEINLNATDDVKIYLIGNKCELEEERQVTSQRAEDFAKRHGISKYFETSACEGTNVTDVFTFAGKELSEQKDAEAKASFMSQGGSFLSPSPTPPPEMSFTDKSEVKQTEESRDLVYLQMMNQI